MLSAYFNVSLAFELCLQRLHIHVNLQKLVIFRSNMAKRKTKKVAGKNVNADAAGDLPASGSDYHASTGGYSASAGGYATFASYLPASANN